MEVFGEMVLKLVRLSNEKKMELKDSRTMMMKSYSLAMYFEAFYLGELDRMDEGLSKKMGIDVRFFEDWGDVREKEKADDEAVRRLLRDRAYSREERKRKGERGVTGE